jgi:RNase H-like domain found in reverse transcriptase
MKALMVEDVLLRYPDHNLPFHICTDVSDCQLGSVILQQDKHVAFYSCKLSLSQQNYATIEKELL